MEGVRKSTKRNRRRGNAQENAFSVGKKRWSPEKNRLTKRGAKALHSDSEEKNQGSLHTPGDWGTRKT